ncbi:ATP11-domain-containing protein [Cylindrobasidium torrendii FP15055 ss-10]|uniref:ATP11-domain-containing protein n=1 Tax=Cylindrobasidium torrendii FP15055 ss-10 TaxID=1314674 RepID=A0A0D7BB68_9AGAR|nr:ATP11-domain-containing protein [Cylindrobasidium torrendii FP15055 ss-10]
MLKSAHEADVASSGASTDKDHVPSRKDSSPVKPLSDILRLPKIAKAKPEQVSALWTAYHASRSEGTGRGYLCASIPLPIYEKMSAVGAKYPTFVVPLARPDADEPTNAEKTNYEFYFMQWNFHEAPPVPSPSDDPFDVSGLRTPSPNPPTSTIIFTPLQEYKLRQSFATPYLILTHYTDLAHSHGQVLLRGEITPTTAGSGYMLAQEDAQRLAMSLQQFYVWGNKDGGGPEGEQLLTKFHTQPEEFKWEDLVKFYNQAP